MFSLISQGHLGAKLLGDDAAHDRAQIFAGFFVDEGVARFVPAKFETCGKRGDPDFADGRVGRTKMCCCMRQRVLPMAMSL